jgi:hypothetical protein
MKFSISTLFAALFYLTILFTPSSTFSSTPSSFSKNQSLAKLLCANNNQNIDSIKNLDQPQNQNQEKEEKIKDGQRSDVSPNCPWNRDTELNIYIKKLRETKLVRQQIKEPTLVPFLNSRLVDKNYNLC